MIYKGLHEASEVQQKLSTVLFEIAKTITRFLDWSNKL